MTPKQERFVQEFMIDSNATQAAVRAGYSDHTAKQQGSRLLTNADVQAAIAEAQEARAERTGLTQDTVVKGHHDLDRSVRLFRHGGILPDDVKTLSKLVSLTDERCQDLVDDGVAVQITSIKHTL